MQPSSIAGINSLADLEMRNTYQRLIPPGVLDRYQLSPFLVDTDGNQLLQLDASPGSSSVELSLYHQHGFEDPILYGHLTDTMNGQIHVLLYIMNDPDSPRFEVDRMPDGTPTRFGTEFRNIDAEQNALEAGLLPGQIRKGSGMMKEAAASFEVFIEELGHQIYFVDPLYYHNAIIFEKYGYAYQSGRTLMDRIQAGFSKGGDLHDKLDGSTFRSKKAANSIRLRSWAIHDGIMGKSFDKVTMYKTIGKFAGIETAPGVPW